MSFSFLTIKTSQYEHNLFNTSFNNIRKMSYYYKISEVSQYILTIIIVCG